MRGEVNKYKVEDTFPICVKISCIATNKFQIRERLSRCFPKGCITVKVILLPSLVGNSNGTRVYVDSCVLIVRKKRGKYS